MPSPAADRNLLFGILALQMDFISRDALIAAMNAWVLDKAKPLGHILEAHGALSGDHRAWLEAGVDKHLAAHGHDPQRSLAALSSLGTTRESLEQIPDADVQASLACVSVARPTDDPYATKPPAVGASTSEGLRFRILRPHARGGLGQVSVALDHELNREVALKEIQDRHADDRDSRARFLLEAEITGGLEHPGIVPVYGLGQYGDGRPYYAMRFIRGNSLKEAIEHFHQAEVHRRDSGERTLALRGLLRRFVDVCNAVAYAHSRGVLHRDLKPGNIMLGKYGETLVVDWGLAKLVGRTPARSASKGDDEHALQPSSGGDMTPTQMGSARGTPAFMSPEQAAGELDRLGPASDVYSLGATLYCLLTGKSPFQGMDLDELLSKVRRGDLVRPRQVKAGVSAALEAICLKAMALKPEARYASPPQLAAEVEHWLADEPVSAYPEPWTARAWRWVRRHRTLAAAGVVTLLAAGVVAGVVAVLSEQGRRAVQIERDEKEKQREQAARARDRTREALDAMISSVTHLSLETQLAITAEQKRFLTGVLTYYQEFAGEQGDDEGTRQRTSRAAYNVGLIHSRLGDREASVRAFEQARAGYEQLAADFPTVPEHRHELANSHNNLGFLLRELGKRPAAEAACRQAVGLLEQLEADFPAVPQYRKDLAMCLINLGNGLRDLGRWPAAEAAFRRALAAEEKLTAEFPAEPQYREGLSGSYNNLGNLLRAQGKRPEAEAVLRQALALQEQLVTDFPGEREYHQGLARSHNNLGRLFSEMGQWPEAEAAYRQSLKLKEKLAADFPTVPQYREELARSHTNLADLFRELKRPEAEEAYRRALALGDKLAADFPAVPHYREELARSHNNLGVLLIGLGKRPEAEAAFRQALALREQLAANFPDVPAYRTELAGSQLNFGNVLLDGGKAAEALAWYDRTMELLKPLLEAEPRPTNARRILRSTHEGRAEALDKLERPADAVTDWDRAVDLSPLPEKAKRRAGRARSLVRAGQVERAVAEAADLAKAPAGDAPHLVDLARVYSLAAGQDETNREAHIKSALHLLHRAVEKGFKDAELLKKDDDLKLLRDHVEFQKLLAELEKKPAKP